MKKIQAYAIFEKSPISLIPIPSCVLKNSKVSVWSIFTTEKEAKQVVRDYKEYRKAKGEKPFAVEIKQITISYEASPIIKKITKK